MHINRRGPGQALIFMLACLTGLAGNAAAASFNCGKAATVVEKSVCANKDLSARDERLAALYKQHLAGAGAVQMKAGQRGWLSALPDNCARSDEIKACLLEKYDQRIALLAGLIALQEPAHGAAGRGTGYRHTFKTISQKYDFELQLLNQCEREPGNTSGSCEAPGVVRVFDKGSRVALQAIAMENIFVSFSQGAAPLANSSRRYDYQGVINVGDFNFDGMPDFAIQNGNSGSYGGPSYDVYLAAPTGKSFMFSPDLTELIASTLGFFQVDVQNKRLKTFAKSGCCYHEDTTYQVVRDTPVPVARTVDEARQDGGVVREERIENGKWKVVSTRSYRPEGFCEEFLENLASDHLSYGKHPNYNDTKACDLIPGKKSLGIFASYYPKRDVVDDLYTDDQYKGLDVLVGDMNDPAALAIYREPAQFLRGKPTGLAIDTAPYAIHPGQRVIGVRTAFAYVGREGAFERLNLFEQSGKALQNVLSNLVTKAETPALSLLRLVSVGPAVHLQRHDILIQETLTIKAAGKKQAPRRQAYRLQFDGSKYVLPEALTAPP